MKFLFLLFISFLFLIQEPLTHEDYVYSYKDKSLKKLTVGHWLRLNSDGTGIIIEWMPCEILWSDSLSWRRKDDQLIVTLYQDKVKRELEFKGNSIIPLYNDNVFMGKTMCNVTDTARFNKLFKQIYFDKQAPCRKRPIY